MCCNFHQIFSLQCISVTSWWPGSWTHVRLRVNKKIEIFDYQTVVRYYRNHTITLQDSNNYNLQSNHVTFTFLLQQLMLHCILQQTIHIKSKLRAWTIQQQDLFNVTAMILAWFCDLGICRLLGNLVVNVTNVCSCGTSTDLFVHALCNRKRFAFLFVIIL